jgi:threonine/homoserine/homoserine lactone efflux protein
MFDLQLFTVFLIGVTALILTPGPDMAFMVAQSAAGGARAGLAAALGIFIGASFHMTLTAFGLAALIAAWPLAFDIVRYAGAAYLLWIAWGIFRNPPHMGDATASSKIQTAFRQGLLTDLLNPKVAMFYLAFLPQFVVRGAVPAWLQIVLLGLTLNIVGAAFNCALAFGGGRLADKMRANPAIGRALAWISGSVMVGLALRLAWPERR